MAVNKERVNKDLKFISESIKKLEILNRLSEDEFLKDFKNIDSTKYLLRTSIEAMVDLSNYVVVSNGWDLPENMEQTFKILCEKEIVKEYEFEEYMELINLKDKLTFMYASIEDEFIYNELKKSITKLKNISESIKILK
ncbi:type VII toxin-antitoxin system HepT family RNase toxin [Clostridium sp. B9]|uniref:type VII toxin-antitoxin system HepT family RNase toxin n=1 Tax=Clostridium sp. B9 TaxID=3423224 RepID=UPI003D2F455D